MLMCVAEWSTIGFVKDSDIPSATTVLKVVGEEEELRHDWDVIVVNLDT